MTRLQAAIGGLLVAPAIVLSIAFGAPEMLSLPPSAAAPAEAAAETKSAVPATPPAESTVDSTRVKQEIFKKMPEALPAAAALVEAPASGAAVSGPQAPSASRCERYLYPVALPKQDGLIDRLFDTRTEQALADQDRRRRLALNCLRAERAWTGDNDHGRGRCARC